MSLLFPVLPGLSSTVEFSDASSSTIAIRFTSWSPDNGNGDVPSGYMIQRRENDTMVWTDALEVNHNVHGTHYSVILDDLQPATVYYIRIIPFIEDAGGSYRGIPTDESGPFATLNFGMGYNHKRQTVFKIIYYIFTSIHIQNIFSPQIFSA